MKKAKHKLKIPSGRVATLEKDTKPFTFLTDIDIETEITDCVLAQSVVMLSAMKASCTEKVPEDGTSGVAIPFGKTPTGKTPTTDTSEVKAIRSEFPSGQISTDIQISPGQNDGVKSPRTIAVSGGNAEYKIPERHVSPGNNAGDKHLVMDGHNNAGRNDQNVDTKMAVDLVPSTSGLQDCNKMGIVSENLTREARSSGRSSIATKDEKIEIVDLTAKNFSAIEKKATLFSEGSGLILRDESVGDRRV